MTILTLSYLKGLMRAYPIFVPFFAFNYGIIFQHKLTLYFALYLIIVDSILVVISKKTSRYVYNVLNREYIFLFGRGKRPKGAKNCGCFIDENDPNKISTSFGMPSGHAIVSMTTSIFWSYYILENYPKDLKRTLSLLLLNSMGIMVSFSRIFLGCHTIQQVIIGSLIGSYIGYMGYKLRSKFM